MKKLNDIIQIRPLVGVDDILLGSDRASVRNTLGEPDRIETEEHVDNTTEETWCFEELGLELVFESDVEFLLGRITVLTPNSEMNECRLIGLPEADFLSRTKSSGLAVVLDDFFHDSPYRDYMCDELNLSFWVNNGVLENICIMPQFDESGQTEVWPERGSANEATETTT